MQWPFLLIFSCASMCKSIQAKYICQNEYYSYIFSQQTQFSFKIKSGLRITVDPKPNQKSEKMDVGFLRYKHRKVKYVPIPRDQYVQTGLIRWRGVQSGPDRKEPSNPACSTRLLCWIQSYQVIYMCISPILSHVHIFYVHTHFNGWQYVKIRSLPRVGIK